MIEHGSDMNIGRFVVRAKEAEEEQFEWGGITWLDNAALTDNEVLTVGVVRILAGKQNPLHQHPNCDEALMLIEGELRHSLGNEVVSLAPGDVIHIPQGVWHQAESTGSCTAKMVVVYNTGRRETVGESL